MRLGTGRLARMADGCAVASFGDTSVLVTAVSKSKSYGNAGFLPLTVDYKQKAAAAGRIPTNFLRRELGPTEKEILTSRLIDRSLRPLFPDGFYNETQVMCNLLAVDGVNDPDVLSINAASAALSVSDIPWNGPVGAVRVGMVDNELRVNPSRREMNQSTLNLVVVSTNQNLVVMLDATAECALQQDFLKAIKLGVKEAQFVVQGITKLQKEVGKEKRSFEEKGVPEDLTDAAKSLGELRLKDVFTNSVYNKLERDGKVTEVRNDVVEKLRESFPNYDVNLVTEAFNRLTKAVFRGLIMEQKLR
jgi:polyribonucleotide nucleotidyltransferase